MRDLSLHILDLIENSVNVRAGVILVTVKVSAGTDSLAIRIEDNGPGFSVTPDVALSPFFTTKSGRKTGLGLSLFRSAAQRAGGDLFLGKSSLGGALVEARMKLTHVDRSPLGDLAATFSSVVCTNPGIDLRVCLVSDPPAGEADPRQFAISSREVAAKISGGEASTLAVARAVSDLIQTGLAEVFAMETSSLLS